MYQSLKSPKYRKSTSVIALKTQPVQNIVFNPRQFQVGQSKIERLPQRTITRRNSQPTLPRTQKYTLNRDCTELQLSLLMKINQKLSKQNKELKRQIQLYKQISKSNSRSKIYLEESSRRDLKNIVVERVNRTKCSSRLASDSQTGLCSSKQISYGQFESIGQMYINFTKKSIKPTLTQYQDQLNKFFTQIKQNYLKLKYLFDNIEKISQSQSSVYNKCQNILESINEVCHVKIQQQKVNKYPGLIQKSKSRVKVQRQIVSSKQKVSQKEDILELLSTEQVVQRFQKYILKIMRSQKIVKILKTNLVVRKFTKKLAEI